MSLSDLLNFELLARLALVLYVIGFLMRDELRLRAVILVACVLLVAFNVLHPGGPLWTPIVHSAVIGLINVVLLLFVIRERSTIGMRGETLALFRRFPTLNPGQFRRLLRAGRVETFPQDTLLCAEGEPPQRLFFVIDGCVTARRDGREFRIGAGNFIGEISFLLGGNATATVSAPAGTRCLVWERAHLDRLLLRHRNLANGFRALLNTDVARKLAASAPEHGRLIGAPLA